MRWLAHVISDDRLCALVEADIRQYCGGADLRDFWRHDSGMTYRWVVSHIKTLPEESRLVRHLRAEEGHFWTTADHHRQDVVDLLQQAVYWLSIEARKGLKGSDISKLSKSAPKRQPRPGEEQQKPRMSTKQELRAFFGTTT